MVRVVLPVLAHVGVLEESLSGRQFKEMIFVVDPNTTNNSIRPGEGEYGGGTVVSF